jgi:quinol monooxygenase YgiN
MIHVLATISLQPNRRDEWAAAFRDLAPLVRQEEGCIEYAAAFDLDAGLPRQAPVAPDEAVVIEKWASVEALIAHLAAPHMASYRERVKSLVREVRLRVLSPV